MAVSTIALYGSPPSSVCSTPQSCQINGHASCYLELGSRSSSSPSNTAPTSQKSAMGGLSCLFSSPTVKHAPLSSLSGGGEELGTLRHDRGEELRELSSSFSYSLSKFGGSSWQREPSPVSVFHGPVSCSSGSVSGNMGHQSSIRGGTCKMFNGFVRNALGTCLDYESPSLEVSRGGLDLGSSTVEDELTFNFEDVFVGSISEPYARELLRGAQLRHKIFREDVVIKAFYEAEQAHRGQMRASGDPYLHHCVETAVLLALVGANSTVVAAGLLHDTLDDSFVTFDHLLGSFGAGVAELVEGSTLILASCCKEIEKTIRNFIWGHFENKRGVNLVKRSDLC